MNLENCRYVSYRQCTPPLTARQNNALNVLPTAKSSGTVRFFRLIHSMAVLLWCSIRGQRRKKSFRRLFFLPTRNLRTVGGFAIKEVLIMPQSYTPEFKKNIVRLHVKEGRTYKSITAEYGVSKASISKWCSQFSKECQEKALIHPDTPNEFELMKENLRLRKELEEAKKENLFLKKAAAFFAKEIDERLIDLSSNIINCLAYAGSCADLKSAQTHTTTTKNNARRIIMPIKQKQWYRFRKSITHTMVWMVTAA